MIRLLQIEFIKLWNNNASKVLIIIYFALIVCIALFAGFKFDIGEHITFDLERLGIFNFPYIWHLNTWIASGLKLFFAIVIVSMVANEYSNKTIKQNLIDGLSKKEYLSSKVFMVILFSFLSTLFVFVLSLILGLLYSDYNEASIIFSDLEYLLAYFIRLFAFFSFCLFLGILVKRAAFALGFLIVWFFIENIPIRLATTYFLGTETAESIMAIMPLESMSNLIKEPISRFEAFNTLMNEVSGEFIKDYAVHWYEIVIVLVWTSIFIYGSYALLKKRDL